MAWENIEDRLLEPLRTKTITPDGTVWLPDSPLSIGRWLSSVAKTDEEVRELEMPRFRFIENRWPIERLVEFDSDVRFDRDVLLAMHVGRRAYLLWKQEDYKIIGAIEPATNAALYRVVISATWPGGISGWRSGTCRNWRPDLIPNSLIDRLNDRDAVGQPLASSVPKGDHPTPVLFGWIGLCFDVPLVRYWHEDVSDPMLTFDEEAGVMRYKATYGDKQRDAQRRLKQDERQRVKLEVPEQKQQSNAPQDTDSNKAADRDKHVA